MNATVQDRSIPLSFQGPATTRVVASFGFWLFLLSDIVMFAALFAAYAVLSGETAGGYSGPGLFDKRHVFIETLCLLFSSVTCGFGMLAIQREDARSTSLWMLFTFILGAAFVGLELSEFREMVARGAGPSHSAFLSSFFMLVGTHGLHVTVGLVWLLAMFGQVHVLGFIPMVTRRLFCFGLFWHALDIVWVGVFTIVYLGAHR